MAMWQVQDQSLSLKNQVSARFFFFLSCREVCCTVEKKGESKDETGRKQEGKKTQRHTSGWPSGPRRCVRVAVSPWRPGVESTSDSFLLGLPVGRIPLRVQGARTCPEHGKVPLREVPGPQILKAAWSL